MINIIKIQSPADLKQYADTNAIVDFLYEHLDVFRDTKSAISKSIDYIFSGNKGFILLAYDNTELIGCLIMNTTGMDEYIPANILVYVAVNKERRGQGIGKAIVQEAMKYVKGSIALHVEYDNPAIHLYERLGFRTKYAEMRWTNPE